ncbi:unnamed protein product [Paramecium sonneborni]|uniref:WD40-repeat-containing domain n=1 Tax=Paramecium sonneborni TaxID=65129 RepID=A0A8S1MP10_9CILI|nr:unnamed protein product [Paramecium sonneborni]
MIEIEQLKCFQNHNSPICSVIIDKDFNKNQRLLCNECMQDFNENLQIKGFKAIYQQIESNLYQNRDQMCQLLFQKKEKLKSLINDLNDWKSSILNQIDSILEVLKYWSEQLMPDKYINKQQSFIDLLEQYLRNSDFGQKDFEQKVNMIIEINQTSFEKIKIKLNKFNSKTKQLLDKFKLTFMEIGKNPSAQVNLKLITKKIGQSENCWTIAFNHNGQIMASGCENDIKIWDFKNGQMTELCTLEGHSEIVSCLIFSKYCDKLISSSYDNSILLWQLNQQQKWICSQKYLEHQDRILCLILSKDERTLISGSNDSTIKVWNVDLNNFKINFNYSLLKHQNRVFGLSMNTSETYLVSCGEDCQIIVWKKDKNNKWEFKQIVNQSIKEWGTKIAFIRENQFIWLTGKQTSSDCICFFELIDGNFQEQQEQLLKLQVNNQVIDYSLFPIMIDKQKDIILFRHKLHIYLLTKKINGKYNVMVKLSFPDNATFGIITNDFKYLVIWEENRNCYSIYEIEYFLA